MEVKMKMMNKTINIDKGCAHRIATPFDSAANSKPLIKRR